MSKFIYLDVNEAKLGTTLVLGVYDAKIENPNSYFNRESVLVEGDDVPHYITYDEETNTIRKATEQERFDRGQYTLRENQYLKDGVIKDMPLVPPNMVKGVFNVDTEQFEETAPLEQVKAKEEAIAKYKFSDELRRVGLYKTEIELGTLPFDEKTDNDLKAYMSAINPYAVVKSRSFIQVDRPSVLDRYI